MKKSLFILFASVLFIFNGSAQCNVPITQTSQSYGSLGPHNDTVFCFNDPVTQTLGTYNFLTGGSGSYTYQWYSTTDLNFQYSNFNMGTWTLINGATNTTYSAPAVTQSIRYKRVTTDVNCPLLTRNDFSYILHLYKVDEIEAIQKTCSPAVTASIIDKTVDPLWKNSASWYTIQWESSNSETGTFTEIPGATNFLYTPPINQNIVYYRRNYSLNPYPHYGGTCNVQLSNVVAINPVTCLSFSSSITGPATIAPNQTATYSVPAQLGMQYLWAVTSGTITGGQGTYTITIMWDGGASANARTSLADYSVSVTETNDIQATKTTTQTITAITTDINKGFGSTGISVFPNPIKNQFTIEMPTANTAVNYNVYSTTGIQMQSGSFNAAASGNTISTQLPAGMYQLVLNYDGVFTSTRLVVVE